MFVCAVFEGGAHLSYGETEDEMADVVYLKIISFLQLFIGRGTITHACGVQRTIYRSQVFSSYHRGPGEGH